MTTIEIIFIALAVYWLSVGLAFLLFVIGEQLWT